MPSQWLNDITPNEWDSWQLMTDRTKAWPVANDGRRFQSFWLSNQGPLVAPMYQRIVTRHDIGIGIENQLMTLLELEGTDGIVATADSGVNALGRRLTLELRNFDTPHPIYNELGIQWDFVYSRAGFRDDVTFGVFNMPNTTQHEFTPFWYDWAFNRGVDLNLRTARPYSSFVPGQDTDWTTTIPRRDIAFHAIPWGRSIPANSQLDPYPPPPV